MLGKRQKLAACSGRLQFIMPAAASSAFMEAHAAPSGPPCPALNQQSDRCSINKQLISDISFSCKPIKPRLQVIGFQPSSSNGAAAAAAAAAAGAAPAAGSPRSVLDAEALSGGNTTAGDHHHHHHQDQDQCQRHTSQSQSKPSSCKSPRSALGSLLMSSDSSSTKKAAIVAVDNHHLAADYHDNHSSSHASDWANKLISEDVGLKIVLRSGHAALVNPAADHNTHADTTDARVQSSNHGNDRINSRDLAMRRQTSCSKQLAAAAADDHHPPNCSGASAKCRSTTRPTSIFSTSPAIATSGCSSVSGGLDFLQACFLCKCSLTAPGKDIYMYRGDKAFCSAECRYHQILLDESQEDSTPTRRTSSSSRRGNNRAVLFNQAASIAAGA